MTSSLRGVSASVNGGPFDGSMATLAAPNPGAGRHHLWLVEVDGKWHAYQLTPLPDSDERAWSHLGIVAELPKLDPTN